MRVISGTYGGRQLKSPTAASDFRPTTDRVKESLFNILEHSVGFDDCRVCDLFAGSGGLGIEALSRGAQSASFVEKSWKHAKLIKDNISMLGVEDQSSVFVKSVETFVIAPSATFDLIFCDPPYNYSHINRLLEPIHAGALLSEDGVFIYEHSGKETVDAPAPWSIVQTRSYGTTAITMLRQEQ
jgi:16S rRNA (guanine966-N2)-methyltransferase